MLFLFLSHRDLEFDTKKLTFRSYITVKTLVITKKVELSNKYKFVKAVLNKNSKTFVIHVTALGSLEAVIPTFLL